MRKHKKILLIVDNDEEGKRHEQLLASRVPIYWLCLGTIVVVGYIVWSYRSWRVVAVVVVGAVDVVTEVVVVVADDVVGGVGWCY